MGWDATGTGVVTTVSDGTDSAATFTYDATNTFNGSWDFIAHATPASANGPIKVPWTWQGLHAWFQVTARLQPIVDGIPVGPLALNAGPATAARPPPTGSCTAASTTFNIPATPGTTPTASG